MLLDSRPWETEVHYDQLSNWICLKLCYLAGCLQQGLTSAVYWLCSYCYCGEVAELKVGSDPYALSVIKMSRNADANASDLKGHATEMSWNLQAALQRADSCLYFGALFHHWLFVDRCRKAANVTVTIFDHKALMVKEETVVDWRRFRMVNSRLSVRSVWSYSTSPTVRIFGNVIAQHYYPLSVTSPECSLHEKL